MMFDFGIVDLEHYGDSWHVCFFGTCALAIPTDQGWLLEPAQSEDDVWQVFVDELGGE